MTPEHSARLAALQPAADRQVIVVPGDGTMPRGAVVPVPVLRWLRDPCSWALEETLAARARGDLSDAERAERHAARRARAALYSDVKREAMR